ncbi:phage virion morphogenesis protein [Flexibacterium corallicola]|uniref:phage virion morphogenesis protein n=1 Tax=Flexibacterium corallicola TaxID=3037259 RepID=UPI00286EFE95|nr:phage virion morphogenesis protein [Pseudovibrio sp. M1P-2-3]
MFTLRFDSSQMDEELKALAGRFEDNTTLHSIMGAALYDQTLERFEREEGPDGKPWAKLSPLTLASRRSKRGTLRATGGLIRSIKVQVDSSKAEVGTNLNHPKVWVHQYGAVIRPRRKKALAIPNGNGGFVFAGKATIPARPYIGLGRGDEEAVREALESYLLDD